MAFASHGNGSYNRGCRCDVCRKAHADYQRERRAAARAEAQKHTFRPPGSYLASEPGNVRYVAPKAKHGTRSGYEYHGCRCLDCTAAHSAVQLIFARRYRAKQATK